MSLITKEDLKTHIYEENLDIITRQDDSIVTTCIEDAESEIKGYLSRFNLLALFGTDNLAPTIDPLPLKYLKRLVKDIAAWHLVTLGNPSCSLELFRTRFKDAERSLEKIQEGKIDPNGWPLKTDDLETDYTEGSNIQSSSNPKQNHHF